MAAAIEVMIGPGQGWKYVLTAEEIRVGRGAGHQVKLEDPAWGGGHLRVQYRQGGYVVTNHMGHPVLLDTSPLTDGEQANWFTGTCLQPTGGTLLRLSSADRPTGLDPEGGVIAVAPGASSGGKRKKMLEWVALGVVLLAAGGLAAKDQFKPAPKPVGEVLDNELRTDLLKDLTEDQAERVLTAIRKGMVCRSQDDIPGARRKYKEAHRLIAELKVGRQSASPSLTLADDFVRARELALDGY